MKRLARTGYASVLLVALGLAGYAAVLLHFDPRSLPENYGNTDAVLFAGAQPNQPLIVLLGGGDGCNAWAEPTAQQRRERLLDQGYAILALEYFSGLCRDEDSETPSDLDRISIDGIYLAVVAAARDSRISRDCIAVVGASAGAMVALTLASYYPDIKAVVGTVPANIVYPAGGVYPRLTSALSHDGNPLPYAPITLMAGIAFLREGTLGLFNAMLDNEEGMEQGAIAVERINGPILLVSATLDEVWPSTRMSDLMIERLRRNNFRHPYQHVPLATDHSGRSQPIAPIVDAFLEEHFLSDAHSGCPR